MHCPKSEDLFCYSSPCLDSLSNSRQKKNTVPHYFFILILLDLRMEDRTNVRVIILGPLIRRCRNVVTTFWVDKDWDRSWIRDPWRTLGPFSSQNEEVLVLLLLAREWVMLLLLVLARGWVMTVARSRWAMSSIFGAVSSLRTLVICLGWVTN